VDIFLGDGEKYERWLVQNWGFVSRYPELSTGKISFDESIRNLRRCWDGNLNAEIYDVTGAFGNTKCRKFQSVISVGGIIVATKIPGKAGMLTKKGYNFHEGEVPCSELLARLTSFCIFLMNNGEGGYILVPQELSWEQGGYGIRRKELEEVRKIANAGGNDLIVFTGGQNQKSEKYSEDLRRILSAFFSFDELTALYRFSSGRKLEIKVVGLDAPIISMAEMSLTRNDVINNLDISFDNRYDIPIYRRL